MREYSIKIGENELIIDYGVVGGETIRTIERIENGLAGRSVSEQLNLRMQSRLNKKIDAGYIENFEKAKINEVTNSLGFKKPMLAHRFDKVKKFDFSEVYCQKKYDGHRCLITNDCGENIAYSRNGKLINSIPEILSEIKIPEGHTIDGELYHHGTPLQTISSWVRKYQENSLKLNFICYDAILKEPYKNRLNFIKDTELGSRAFVADTALMIGEFNPLPILKNAIEEGYEGLILRQNIFSYEDGKRSNAVIKVKQFLDDEFLIVGISASVDGFAIFQCEAKNKKLFSVTCHGTHQEKIYVLKNKEMFLGKFACVEYANLTKDGIPFHPVSKCFRDKEGE